MRFLLPLCFALAACSSDPAPPVDSGPADIGIVDSGWPWADAVDAAGDDRMALPDFGPRDTGADVAAVGDGPAVDVVDAAAVDAGVDVAAVGDAGSDVPVDARADVPAGSVNCGALPREPACGSHADCAMCITVSSGEPWCCGRNGYCGVAVGASVCPPPACNASSPCATGQTCCDGACHDLQTDPMTCGSCNARCAGRVCRAGACVVADAGSDAAHD